MKELTEALKMLKKALAEHEAALEVTSAQRALFQEKLHAVEAALEASDKADQVWGACGSVPRPRTVVYGRCPPGE